MINFFKKPEKILERKESTTCDLSKYYQLCALMNCINKLNKNSIECNITFDKFFSQTRKLLFPEALGFVDIKPIERKERKEINYIDYKCQRLIVLGVEEFIWNFTGLQEKETIEKLINIAIFKLDDLINN
jgi:hypothetical protein